MSGIGTCGRDARRLLQVVEVKALRRKQCAHLVLAGIDHAAGCAWQGAMPTSLSSKMRQRRYHLVSATGCRSRCEPVAAGRIISDLTAAARYCLIEGGIPCCC